MLYGKNQDWHIFEPPKTTIVGILPTLPGGWALPVVVLLQGVPRALRSRLNVGHAGSNPGAPFLCYFRVVLVSRRGKALPILPGAVRMRAEWRRMRKCAQTRAGLGLKVCGCDRKLAAGVEIPGSRTNSTQSGSNNSRLVFDRAVVDRRASALRHKKRHPEKRWQIRLFFEKFFAPGFEHRVRQRRGGPIRSRNTFRNSTWNLSSKNNLLNSEFSWQNVWKISTKYFIKISKISRQFL